MVTAFSVNAQKASQTVTSLLNSYYEVKNALVYSDVSTASVKADEFIKTSNSVDMNAIPADKMNAFMFLLKKLVSGAEHIATATDIKKQRDYFADFSLDFYSLAKMVKLTDQPVYQAYCPMKKIYWLSNEKTIKNPYYGKMMLTCGSITETINP